ncbi:MAG: hypothetical protein R2796_10045 [Chitinophagaceae bacterium]|nr:hypothetical protein [Chitinophagaceae bacterium]MCB0740248.1 hypothetical protein [Chitinophagaceae bacterium]HQV05632.1 hypothetical protein [Chitinophagaceae bacterium]
MEEKKKYKGLWWLSTFVFTGLLLLAIFTHWPWLTMILPFATTSFVKAMDVI